MTPKQTLVPTRKRGTGTAGAVVDPSLTGLARLFAARPDFNDSDVEDNDLLVALTAMLCALVGTLGLLFLTIALPAYGGSAFAALVLLGVAKVAFNRHNAERRIALHDVPKDRQRDHRTAVDAAQRIAKAARQIGDNDLINAAETERAAAEALWTYADCTRKADRLKATLSAVNTGSDEDHRKFAECRTAINTASETARTAYGSLMTLRNNTERLAKTLDKRRQSLGFEAEALIKQAEAAKAFPSKATALSDRALLLDREYSPLAMN